MNKSNLQYFIPTKGELHKIIRDEDTDEVLLATDGQWKVTLWLSEDIVDGNTGITTGRVEIYNEKLHSEEALKINEDINRMTALNIIEVKVTAKGIYIEI